MDSGSGKPASANEAERSVEVVASTEEPTLVLDWNEREGRLELVLEVLLMSGCRLPSGDRVPFLDTHSRKSVADIIGSFRHPRVAMLPEGECLVGSCHFSATQDGESAYRKTLEGHITDVSVGYEVNDFIWIDKGRSETVGSRTFEGPLRVVTDWTLKELSLCPIGADPNAKFRHQQQPPAPAARTGRSCGHKKEKAMAKETAGGSKTAKTENRSGILARLRSVLIALGLRAEEETPEEERQDVELVDENGNPIEPAELTEEELITVVEGLEEVLAEAEEELAAQEEGTPPSEDEQRKAAAKSGKRALALPARSVRSLSPTQAARAERARVLAIQNMARAHNIPEETTSQFIESGASLTAAKAKVFDMRNGTQTTGPGFRVSMGNTEQEKFPRGRPRRSFPALRA